MKYEDIIYNQLIKFKINNNQIGPVGYAQIYLGGKLVEEKSNLVLGQGRSFVGQRIFDTNITDFYQEEPDYKNHIVSHFAVGAGGSVITSNDEYTLQGPHICDNSLYRPISLGNITSYLDSPNEYSEGNPLYSHLNSVKQIEEKTLLETIFPSQETTEGQSICSYFTKVKCICRLQEEPASLPAGQSIQISEAGLYAVKKDFEVLGEEPNPCLFAHICFSPKFKEKEQPFGIIWYILC